MKKEKPLIFISHIKEEKDVAIFLKNLIDTIFSKKIDVFVSSDDVCVPLGGAWLNHIEKALRECIAIVIISSPKSVLKPWINFEFGTGWIRDLPIIPACHSGMNFEELPLPLKLRESIMLKDKNNLNVLFSQLSNKSEIPISKTDYSEFIKNIEKFEKNYLYWDIVNGCFEKIDYIFRTINYIDVNIIDAIKSKSNIHVELIESDVKILQHEFRILEQYGILKFRKENSARLTPSGFFIKYKIERLPEFHNVISDRNFVFC